MKLISLEITDVRNIRSSKLFDLSEANLVFGENGAGKTSVLEAIFFLGMARSFRSPRVQPFINHDSSLCRVFGELMDGEGACHRLGIERLRRGGFAIKADGKPLNAASELAQLLPVQLINSQSFALLEGGSKERRKLMDWGVFHVEPHFLPAWSRVRRALTQRNGLLKGARSSGAIRAGSKRSELLEEIRPWDLEIARNSVAIARMRGRYFERFCKAFQSSIHELSQGNCPDIELGFLDGWPRHCYPSLGEDPSFNEGGDGDARIYLDALSGSLDSDLYRGTTTIGPQRADLSIKVSSVKASDILSRGQQKLVVVALKLAQCALFIEDTGRKPVLLADDLPAEIDQMHQEILFRKLSGLGMQCFFTALDSNVLELGEWQPSLRRVFHVKQGDLSVAV